VNAENHLFKYKKRKEVGETKKNFCSSVNVINKEFLELPLETHAN
jgi:hypothetical protein